MATMGWVVDQNLIVEIRSADGHFERLPQLAAELVRLEVDAIVTLGAPETEAAKQATRTIPIVFHVHGDPVGRDHIASLAKPGGNITGGSTDAAGPVRQAAAASQAAASRRLAGRGALERREPGEAARLESHAGGARPSPMD